MADLETYASDEVITFAVTGFAPNSFFAQRFGDGKDMRTLFDAPGFSELKLKVTNGAAGGAGAVVVQELRD